MGKDEQNHLAGKIYEAFIGDLLERQGMKVLYTGFMFGNFDKGIDLIAVDLNRVFLIQCKNWSTSITPSVIHQLHGIKTEFMLRYSGKYNIAASVFTNSSTLSTAKESAKVLGITIEECICEWKNYEVSLDKYRACKGDYFAVVDKWLEEHITTKNEKYNTLSKNLQSSLYTLSVRADSNYELLSSIASDVYIIIRLLKKDTDVLSRLHTFRDEKSATAIEDGTKSILDRVSVLESKLSELASKHKKICSRIEILIGLSVTVLILLFVILFDYLS